MVSFALLFMWNLGKPSRQIPKDHYIPALLGLPYTRQWCIKVTDVEKK
jgi:hypothetical protein